MNNATLRFLAEGVFEANFPGVASTSFSTGRGETFDFIGLNYYTRFLIHLNPLNKNPVSHRTRETSADELTDMGWEIYPDGLARALRLIHSFTAKPIYVTENGIADEKDSKRGAFIRDHIAAIDRSIMEGIDVRGYFYWSLLDNFEWAFGYTRRFGLYSVDFTTQKRTLREGSVALRDIIRSRRPGR
jgi:beta-glucosidase